MKAFLANPFIVRLLGALGAGLTAYAIPPHDVHAAVIAALGTLGYALTHTTVSAATKPGPSE